MGCAAFTDAGSRRQSRDGFSRDLGELHLHPEVAVRVEPFGVLLYHYGTRRLAFAHGRKLGELVTSLRVSSDLASAVAAVGISDSELGAYTSALESLVARGMLVVGQKAGAEKRLSSSNAQARVAPARGSMIGLSSSRNARLARGLGSPICLTWELTYGCNLACVHCLSSSGRRDPSELTTPEAMSLIDDLAEMKVFYVNIGGGEPTIRRDFWDLVEYATSRRVGVKFSTNGSRITPKNAEVVAGNDYVDVQVSIDGSSARENDAVRGIGSFDCAVRALRLLEAAGARNLKLSVVVNRHNVRQLDALKALAKQHGAQLRVTRMRPSGRAVDSWESLRLSADQQRQLYEWLLAQGEEVLTGDSFFHLAGFGAPLPGMNMCGAGRIVCLIDPIGDVFACPFAIHESLRAGNIRDAGGFGRIWGESELFAQLRRPRVGGACTSCGALNSCGGGCMAAKFFTGLPVEGPDPECVMGHGEKALASINSRELPRPSSDHSRHAQEKAVAVDVPPPTYRRFRTA